MNVSPISNSAPFTVTPAHVAAKIYSNNTPASLSTSAAGFFAGADVDIVHDLKRSLMQAINCGDFDKAIHIIKCLKELGT
jgi:hypothetical protein